VRVLVAEPIATEGVARLRAHHDVDERPGLTPAELCGILGDYDALVVRSQVHVDAATVAAGIRLQVIGRAGVGVDNVDLEAATRAGITVVNAPTGNTIAAAEHTLALLYGVARRIAAADASVRRGEWKRAQFTGLELRGRTLGIVGLGKIGQAIAARARAMEMIVLAADPFVTAEQAQHHGVELVSFDDLLTSSDVVSVHVPLTRSTRGLVGAAELARMKPGAIVLNVARGGVVDEAALNAALRSGHVGGAGIDVFESEPPTGSPLLEAPNTLLTPHLGASTAEAQVAVAEEVADQVLDVLAGRSARYAVNAPLVTPETAEALAPYLPLAEILGRFFAQFSRTGVKTLTLEIAGDLSSVDGSPLIAAALRGLLETSTTERVNLVNAAALAKARGITVVERKTPDAGAYAAQLTLSGQASGAKPTTVGGTVAGGEPRLTRLNDYHLDMEPTEVMLITHHRDRPGMIGRIGQTLGEADVNISAMHVGRSAPRADALMILALDDDVSPSVAEAIRGHDSVIDTWTIRLGSER
jgi:D-3-phosphoglycerate dehydrogenase